MLLKALRPLGYATAGFCKWAEERWGAWKKHTTNACWIQICIAMATLSLCEQLQSFPCQLKYSVGVKDSCGMGTPKHILYVHARTHAATLLPHLLKQDRGPERGGRERGRGGGGGGVTGMWITNQQLQLATGWRSFAYAHASFICITLPQCKTLHLFCKC